MLWANEIWYRPLTKWLRLETLQIGRGIVNRSLLYDIYFALKHFFNASYLTSLKTISEILKSQWNKPAIAFKCALFQIQETESWLEKSFVPDFKWRLFFDQVTPTWCFCSLSNDDHDRLPINNKIERYFVTQTYFWVKCQMRFPRYMYIQIIWQFNTTVMN